MRFTTGRRLESQYEWHRWFAWYPVCVGWENNHIRHYRWLCFVERRLIGFHETSSKIWAYRNV